jgi:hypothetical protein
VPKFFSRLFACFVGSLSSCGCTGGRRSGPKAGFGFRQPPEHSSFKFWGRHSIAQAVQVNRVEGQGKARGNLSVYAVNRPYLEKAVPSCFLL